MKVLDCVSLGNNRFIFYSIVRIKFIIQNISHYN